MKRKSWWLMHAEWATLVVLLFLLPTAMVAEPVTLKHVVELALTHATTSAISSADQQHADAGYRELHSSYIPQIFGGAGLGASFGFPLSLEGAAPSLFNLNAQSALINPALRAFIRAARTDSTAASLRTKDQRNQLIQDTVLSYAELQKWEQRLARLQESEAAAQTMQAAVAQRVKEGIDSEVEGTKARLSAARVHLWRAEAQGAADVLRQHLSTLTGLPASNLQTEPESFPTLPASSQEEDTAARAADTNPGVQAALEHARAQYLRADGEHRSLLPSVDFAAQYALLSTYNNYNEFYKTFQRNNATVGVSVRIPLLNQAQRARAQGAYADAIKAKKQAEADRDQVSEETVRLQRSITQMQAARDVAVLEYEIAQQDIGTTQTRMDAGTATLHDLDYAHTRASERFIALQDVTFELERSQVGLLRSTGDLEKWALGTN